MREIVSTPDAPAAVGPYSQAVKVTGGSLLFCSGQIGLDPATGELVGPNVEEQCHRVMENLAAVLLAAGADLSAVVKTTIYLADINDFAVVNNIYEEYFSTDPPARATVESAHLPKGARVEIDAVARLEV